LAPILCVADCLVGNLRKDNVAGPILDTDIPNSTDPSQNSAVASKASKHAEEPDVSCANMLICC
jgi:hypothetical protein